MSDMSGLDGDEIIFVRDPGRIAAISAQVGLPESCREGLLAMAVIALRGRLHGVWGAYAAPAAGAAERYAPLWRDGVLLEPGAVAATAQDLWHILVADAAEIAAAAEPEPTV